MKILNTYDNWRAITESDFVTLFIKTWFAFISTLRHLHPEALNKNGDGRYLKYYKICFKDKYMPEINFSDVNENIFRVYKSGIKIVAENYPDYFFKDFYGFSMTFKQIYQNEEFKLIFSKAKDNQIRLALVTIDPEYIKKVGKSKNVITFNVNCQDLVDSIINENLFLDESKFLAQFYSALEQEMIIKSTSYIDEIRNTIPERGNKKFLNIFDRMLAFSNITIQKIKTAGLDISINDEAKIIYQVPISMYIYQFEDGERFDKDIVKQEKLYIWFLHFVYRLRNALFHEIIDPLDKEWQEIFKSSYLVLKQILDANIEVLKKDNDNK